ncbi:MAG: RimK family alpha-L-glutamate ligase [Hyphomonadaceae bacterium]
MLAARGLRHIPSQLFFVNDAHKHLRGQGRELADARAFAAAARYPIFCKPIDGSQGAFAEIISDEAQFARYLARVGARHYAILVQPVIEAPEYRVFVLDGRALFSYRKARPLLTGDGKSTLQELARAPETVRAYDEKGACYRAADVAPAGALLHLEGAANLAAGGAAENLTTQTPARFADVAIAATSAIGLRLAAVDLFDLAGDLIIIEVNSSPAIKTLELHDRWDLIETIWTANIDAALL